MNLVTEELGQFESLQTRAPRRPAISVIMVTYNGSQYLEQGLESVLAESGPGCELVVVDNGSTDGSAAFIASNYPQVKLICNDQNTGFAAACNQGAAQSGGEVLVFLNQDTRVEQGWLDGLVAGLSANERVALTTGKVLLMSQPERIHLCGQEVHYTGLVFGRGYLLPATSMSQVCSIDAVSGAYFAIRREVWESLGGFDETFHMYYEETDLCWRAHMAGYSCRYEPDSIVHHDYRPGTNNPARLYYSMRNRSMLTLKNWRGGTLLLISPGLLLAELVEIYLALRHGWGGLRAKLRAYAWMIQNLSIILHSRKQAQHLRSVSDAEILQLYTYRLSPQELSPLPYQDRAVKLLESFFYLNYRVALSLCRVFGL